MNPENLPPDTELIWRRLVGIVDGQAIALPVLFGFVALFILACLRREKGFGTLAWGMSFLVLVYLFLAAVPMIYYTLGVETGKGFDSLEWWGKLLALLAAGCMLGLLAHLLFDRWWLTAVVTVVGTLIAFPILFVAVVLLEANKGEVADALVRYGLGALITAGFMKNLSWEIFPERLLSWAVGGLSFMGYLAWVALTMSYLETANIRGGTVFVPVLPIFALFLVQVLVSAWRAGIWWSFFVVLGVAVPYIFFADRLRLAFTWWVVLVPVLAIALFYVGMMYVKDARSIHPLWAGFLGLLRVAVYAILSIVFLLPGCQEYQTRTTYSKVLVLFDVSGSMNNKDELPKRGQKEDNRLTRQQMVLTFLTSKTGPNKQARAPWIERLLEKSPATVYRFGAAPDEVRVQKFDTKGEDGQFDPELVAAGSKFNWTRFLTRIEEDLKLTDAEKRDSFKTEEEQLKEKARRETLLDYLTRATDCPYSANRVAEAEALNDIQAIIIFSDGRTNTGSSKSLDDFQARVANAKPKIHVFTVGVGHFKQPVVITIDKLQAPQKVRPDDRFPLKVPVIGRAELRDQDFDVFVEATRDKDKSTTFRFAHKRGTFQGSGEFPQEVIDFDVDVMKIFIDREAELVKMFFKAHGGSKVEELKAREKEFMRYVLQVKDVKIRNLSVTDPKVSDEEVKTKFMKEYLEGEWEFVARVPTHKNETFKDDEHVSAPARVLVQNKPLRVLLFAGGPTRDYQFVRTLLAREMQQQRIELSIYLQTAGKEHTDQEVPPERLLKHFPHRRGPDHPTDRFSSINEYDLIIAFDPDWTELDANIPENTGVKKTVTTADISKLLDHWVSRESGSIIFVAGPVFTYQLARKAAELKEIKQMLPVELNDYRLTPLGLSQGIDMKRPWSLNFSASSTPDFLKLNSSGEGPTAGWEKFFWGKPGKVKPVPEHGFFYFYPVKNKRADTQVVATFAGPKTTYLKDGSEHPYIALMRYGSGKTIYIGSSESWRLRQASEKYHENFWLNLARFATTGTKDQQTFGRFVASGSILVGPTTVEAQIKEAILKPPAKGDEKREPEYVPGDYLPRNEKVKVTLVKEGAKEGTKPVEFEMRAKNQSGPWLGWFEAKIKVPEKGNYKLFIQVPAMTLAKDGKTKLYSPSTRILPDGGHKLIVEEVNAEEANLKEDFPALRELATDAEPIVKRVPREIEPWLPPVSVGKFSTEGRKLFFPLAKADNIPSMLQKLEPKKERVKGAIRDLWDQGSAVKLVHLLWSVPLALFLLAAAILMFHQRWVLALISLALSVLVPLVSVVVYFIVHDADAAMVELNFAFVLVIVVTLLGLEWLTRKLLKLA